MKTLTNTADERKHDCLALLPRFFLLKEDLGWILF